LFYEMRYDEKGNVIKNFMHVKYSKSVKLIFKIYEKNKVY
jgi:hypothetical protein